MSNPKQQKDPLDEARNFFKKIDYPDDLLYFTNNGKAKDTIEELKAFVYHYVREINPSQIRNLYASAKAIHDQSELQLLRPKLAYVAARQTSKKKQAETFIQMMDDLISKGIKIGDFISLFEAIVAYHKYYSS